MSFNVDITSSSKELNNSKYIKMNDINIISNEKMTRLLPIKGIITLILISCNFHLMPLFRYGYMLNDLLLIINSYLFTLEVINANKDIII